MKEASLRSENSKQTFKCQDFQNGNPAIYKTVSPGERENSLDISETSTSQ